MTEEFLINNQKLFIRPFFCFVYILDFLTSIPTTQIGQKPIKTVWEDIKNCTTEDCQHLWLDQIISSLKYISASLDLATKTFNGYFTSIIEEDVDIFTLAGFEANSGPFRIFSKLPEMFRVLVDTYRNKKFEEKISKILKKDKVICKDIFRNVVIMPNVSITKEQLMDFSKYICISVFDYPILRENIFLEAISELQNMYLTIPVDQLNFSFTSIVDNAQKLDIKIQTLNKNGLKMKEFFEKDWSDRMMKFLEDFADIKFSINTTLTRYFSFFPKQYSDLIFGFQKYTLLTSHIYEQLHNISTSQTFDNGKEDIDKLTELFKQYPIELTSTIAEAIENNLNYENTDFYSDFCKKINFGLPTPSSKYAENFTEKFCQINTIAIEKEFPTENYKDLKQYNFIIEDLISAVIKNMIYFEKGTTVFDFKVEELHKFNLSDSYKFSNLTFGDIQNMAKKEAKYYLNNYNSLQQKILINNIKFERILYKLLKGGDFWPKIMEEVEYPANLIPKIIQGVLYLPLDILKTITTSTVLYDLIHKSILALPTICDYEFKGLEKDNILPYIHKLSCIIYKTTNKQFDWKIMDGNTITEEVLIKNLEQYAEIRKQYEEKGVEKLLLPKFLDAKLIERKYVDYSEYAKQPLSILQSFSSTLNQIVNIASIFYLNETNCNWCTIGTKLVKELNRHIAISKRYVELTCKIPDKNASEIQDILLNDFRWNRLQQIHPQETYDINDFDQELHQTVNILSTQLILFASNSTLQSLAEDCLTNLTKAESLRNISTYFDIIKNIMKLINDPGSFPQSGGVQKMEENVQLFKPLVELIDEEKMNYFFDRIKANDDFKPKLAGLLVNINEALKFKHDSNATNIDDTTKIFQFLNHSELSQEDLKSVNYSTFLDILNLINEDKLNMNLAVIKYETKNNPNWFSLVYKDLENILQSLGDVLSFILTNDIEDLFQGKYNISSLLKGVLKLAKRKSVDILFDSLKDLVNALTPKVLNDVIKNDLLKIINALESMDIFKKLNLIHLTYNVSDFVSAPIMKEYLTEDLQLNSKIVDALLVSSIDIMEILSTQKDLGNFSCNTKEVANFLEFYNEISAKEATRAICSLGLSDIEKIVPVLIKNIDFSHLLNQIIDSSLENVVKESDLTRQEGKDAILHLGSASKLLNEYNFEALIKGVDSQNINFNLSSISPELLTNASSLICGRRLELQSYKLVRILIDTQDFLKAEDDEEVRALETPFCKSIYSTIVKMGGGKIIWTYIKPLLRGKILYTPNVPLTQTIIKEANLTFVEMDAFKNMLGKMALGLQQFDVNTNVTNTSFSNSTVMKLISQIVLNHLNLSNEFPLEGLNIDSSSIKQLQSMMDTLSNLMDCVLINRFVGVANEKELEEVANALMLRNEFIGGVVFENLEDSEALPSNVTYKIRMDIENTPTTQYLKDDFWTPGPEDDFLMDLRYFRSFIQLQDMIDSAIIRLKASLKPTWNTYTQQIPYPCWTNDYFKSGMSISQSFQVCFFFGLIVLVATAVRYIVLERESGNTMLMNIMGLKYLVHVLSWLIMTLFQMLVLIVVIVIVLKAGNILTYTSPSLLFIYLVEFGFSAIMFCYMVSSFFNSASLGGVASVIFYLLSFMPYIIIISLESTLSIWLRLLTKLFMSTSFCYGCLYMIRFEVQGVGLHWNNIWENPIPDDPMTFGHSLLFLLIDSMLYGIIGYILSRKAYGKNYLGATVEISGYNESLKVGVSITGLTKIYNSSKKHLRAIDNIEMSLYKGQITTILGHNGAGKTTLIKILTGMMPATSGKVIINNDMSGQYLGVCAQKSILIENLTPREHLFFYARLKTSQSYADVFVEVIEMIESVGLGPLVNELVADLSEGIRRRLCVAIAFIGKPKLVILDEPSSGVDPVARRQIWELILKHREGRTVLLSTHYLDEAELLSDRIVILHKGKLICAGSPLELKHNYGRGYEITFDYPSLSDSTDYRVKSLMNTIKNTAYNAVLSKVKDNKACITVPYKTADDQPNDFENLALVLEQNQDKLGYSNFTMNSSTLENVFLDLCKMTDTKDSSNIYGFSASNGFNLVIPYSGSENNKESPTFLTTEGKMTGKSSTKIAALIKKRFIHCLLDWRIILCAFVLPTLFTAIAMGFSLIRPSTNDDPSLRLTPDLYSNAVSFLKFDPNNNNPFPTKITSEVLKLNHKKTVDYNGVSRHCNCSEERYVCTNSSQKISNGLVKMSSINDTVNWLLETQDEYIERRYGGWSIKDNNFVVWYNNKGHHSMPGFLNLLNNALLNTLSPRSTITTYNHPLKLSPSQLNKSTIAQYVADVGIAVILLIAFTLVLASNSIYLVQERVNEEKRLQFLSGVTPNLYWSVTTLWDIFVLLVALCLAVVVFKIFGLTIYVGRDNLQAVCLLIVLYGLATIPFFHIMEKFFQDTSMANVILFCTYMFTGVAQITCILLIDIIGDSSLATTMRNVLYEVYLVFPPFAFIDGLVEVSKNNIQSELLQRFKMDTYVTPVSWGLLGKHFIWMTLLSVVFFVVNLAIENNWWRRKHSKNDGPDFSDNYNSYAVEIVDLKKVYKGNAGKKVAVDGVSLKIARGECVGLIGVNGAGKSTTFKMLTTEVRPTSGRIYIEGHRIGSRPLCTGELGYCPQCDGLDPKLTVRQILQFYCQLRGTTDSAKLVEKVLHEFQLKRYENRRCENLSGGNKRKLCTVVSILGRSSVILMDEPTSGMDPHSKALTGNLIKQLKKMNKSVILTSHSVEDCENLCSSVVVMINGKIVCEGSPQELKERYESGYILSVRLSEQEEQEKMEEQILKSFAKCVVHNRQYCTSQFLVYTENTTLSQIFSTMNSLSNNISVKDFSLVQSSLDQVFINLAKKSGDNVDNFEGPNSFTMSIM